MLPPKTDRVSMFAVSSQRTSDWRDTDWEDQPVDERLEALVERREVPAAGVDEIRDALQLGETDCSLEVGRLQVEAEMGIDVLVVVARR
jgi:hypothetical protein